MPLNPAEIEILASYIDEYMAVEVGPVGRMLQEQGLYGAEIVHLLDAYSRSHPPRLVTTRVNGRPAEVLMFGQPTTNPPAFPWRDAETARRRDGEILTEREAKQ